jgi:hypothetical protein
MKWKGTIRQTAPGMWEAKKPAARKPRPTREPDAEDEAEAESEDSERPSLLAGGR